MNILRLVKDKDSPKFKELQSQCKDKKQCDIKIPKSELKERLSITEYRCTQEQATERQFSGKYLKLNDEGVYQCIACGLHLFRSNCKYNHSCGWPSFSDVIDKENVTLLRDNSHGMRRIEVTCSKCGAHLGHVFDDGPRKTTGVRYCINSASLDFRKHTSI